MKINLDKEKQLKLSKILVIVYLSLTFINVLLPDEFVIGIDSLDYRLSAFQMIMRWFNYIAFAVLPVAVYFNRPTFKKIAIYFCLPVTIIFACMFGEILPYMTSELGTGIADIRYLPAFIPALMRNGVFRGIIFFATILTQLGTIALLILRDWTVVKFKKEDILPFAIILPLLILSMVPVYAPESIFDTDTNIAFKPFIASHFIWIAFMVAEIFVCTVIFKKRSYEDRYILVFIMAITLFLQFNQLFSSLGELTCKRMPFQLCNIAAYLILVSIVSKNRSLFLFNILINVAGGIIAAIVMDVNKDKGILNHGNVHYILEHHNVIVVPLLCLILGIFKPITQKDFKNYAIYFTAYYLFVFILGTTFNAIYKATDSRYFYCNYMFMFDQETAAGLIPFAGKLFDVKIAIGAVTIYPIIQPVIYATFFAIGTGMFYLLKFAVKEKTVTTDSESVPTDAEPELVEVKTE